MITGRVSGCREVSPGDFRDRRGTSVRWEAARARSLRQTVCRNAAQGTGVASSSRSDWHDNGLIRARWLIAVASSGAAARSRLW
jgi:hypothetical protein